MRIKTFIPLLMMAALTVSLSSCKHKKEQKLESISATSGVAKMVCDQSFEKIMQQEVEIFSYQYPTATVLDKYMPENDCVDSLLHGHGYRLAVITRELSEAEFDYLKARKKTPRSSRIAVDAVAVIANPKNPIEAISTSDLKKIMSGEITDWKWIEPGNNSGEIKVVFDDQKSSTVNYIRDNVMNGQKFASNVYAQGSNDKVFETVSKTPGAIGIIGVSWLSKEMDGQRMSAKELSDSLVNSDNNLNIEQREFSTEIKVLGVSGPDSPRAYKPYQAYIYEKGAYPLVRSIYMICTAPGNTPDGGFYSFVTGVVGQKLITKTGVLPGQIYQQIYTTE